MGALRFQRRIGLGPLGQINLSKSGASLSLGVRGARLTLGRTPHVTIGLPGSGLSFTKTLPIPWNRTHRGGVSSPRGFVAFIARMLAVVLGLAIGFAVLAAIVATGPH